MKIIYIDKSKKDIDQFEKIVKSIPYIELVETFTNINPVFDFVINNNIEAVILNISIGYSSGVMLIQKILEYNKNIIIAIITEDSNLAIHAYEIGAVGYLLKPYTHNSLIALIEKVYFECKSKKPITVTMFGDFSLSINGTKIYFEKPLVQEMFAYLVHKRNQKVSKEEIINILYNKNMSSMEEKMLFKQLCLGIKTVFSCFDFENVFFYDKDDCWLNYNLISSDYYSFLDGENIKITKPYLPEYEWAKIKKKG